MSGIIAAASAAGLSALGSGYKLYQGEKTRKKGERMEDNLSRYKYEIPEEILDNQKTAKNLANQGIPDAEKNLYLDNVNTNAANTINSLNSRKGAILGAEAVGKQVADANRELRVANTKQRLRNLKESMLAHNVVAEYKDKKFQLNEIDPYEDNLNYARSLQGAGRMTTNNAIDSVTASANSYLQGYASTMNTPVGTTKKS